MTTEEKLTRSLMLALYEARTDEGPRALNPNLSHASVERLVRRHIRAALASKQPAPAFGFHVSELSDA